MCEKLPGDLLSQLRVDGPGEMHVIPLHYPFGVAIPLGHCMVKIVDRDSVLLHHFFGRSIVNEFVAFGIMRGIRRDRGGGGPDDLGAIPFQQGHNPCQILGILIDRVVPCPGTAAKDVVQSSDQS